MKSLLEEIVSRSYNMQEQYLLIHYHQNHHKKLQKVHQRRLCTYNLNLNSQQLNLEDYLFKSETSILFTNLLKSILSLYSILFEKNSTLIFNKSYWHPFTNNNYILITILIIIHPFSISHQTYFI